MDLQEIRKIVELMNEQELTYFHLQRKDFALKLKKGADLEALRRMLAMATVALPGGFAPGVAGNVAAAAAAAAAPDGEEITSPMVGTFYRRPTPEADPFVSVGEVVVEGQTLCIIEAMKVMNEIKAERSGTIMAVLAEEGAPVQFGDALFRIK